MVGNPPAKPAGAAAFPLGLGLATGDIRRVPNLIESLAAELERPRPVTAQVISHIVGTYGIARDELGAFLINELPKLEDYEIDLILSPLFTPTLHDQSVFARLLGRESIPATQWPTLVQELVLRPTRAQLVTEDGRTQPVPLRDVAVERYVNRLRLDATISAPLFALIRQSPATDQGWLSAIARRAVWEQEGRHEILVRYLTTARTSKSYRLEDTAELLKLVETYQPANAAELLAHIPHWLQVVRQEINEASGAKPFFNERVQDLHGGGRDQRRQDNLRITTKEQEIAFLERLQQMLGARA